MQPMISIIIVNYNVKDLIDSCISSVKKHCDAKQFEIIVVDNDSADGSVEFLKKKYPDVIVIDSKHNNGFAKANNIGLEHSKGEYILLLNPDTEFIEDSLSPILDLMSKNPHYGAVGCKLLNSDLSLQPSCFDFPNNINFFVDHTGLSKKFPDLCSLKKNINYDKFHKIDFVRGAFLFTRRSVINQCGFLDNRYFMYAEETDFCYQLKHKGFEVVYSPVTSVIHHQGQSSKQINVKMFIERYKSLFKFFSKNKNQFHVFILKVNCILIFSGGMLIYKLLELFSKKDFEKKYYKDRVTGIKGVLNKVALSRI